MHFQVVFFANCDIGVGAEYLTKERFATTLPLREETLFLASIVSRRVACFQAR